MKRIRAWPVSPTLLTPTQPLSPYRVGGPFAFTPADRSPLVAVSCESVASDAEMFSRILRLDGGFTADDVSVADTRKEVLLTIETRA